MNFICICVRRSEPTYNKPSSQSPGTLKAKALQPAMKGVSDANVVRMGNTKLVGGFNPSEKY